MIKIAVINGSARENNMTGYALNIVIKELRKNKNIEVITIELKNFSLPIPGLKIKNNDSQKLRDLLTLADAYIIGTPEYNGSYTALIKLMIENMGYPTAVKGKPIGLLGVATGSLGAVKSLEHLRSVCSHIGGIVLPRVVSIAQIDKYIDTDGNCTNKKIETEIAVLAKNLIEFIKGRN